MSRTPQTRFENRAVEAQVRPAIPVQNLTKILIGCSLLKTSRHFQDPPNSTPQRGPKNHPEEAQNRLKTGLLGTPPKWAIPVQNLTKILIPSIN